MSLALRGGLDVSTLPSLTAAFAKEDKAPTKRSQRPPSHHVGSTEDVANTIAKFNSFGLPKFLHNIHELRPNGGWDLERLPNGDWELEKLSIVHIVVQICRGLRRLPVCFARLHVSGAMKHLQDDEHREASCGLHLLSLLWSSSAETT
jgi:hypothetical protein